ncbi:hypothetical protein XENTR_v10015182 [Xenopus tropicalis]|nr:hypothetical protein XENTR_v10015182 [Xenopus tropicalis]
MMPPCYPSHTLPADLLLCVTQRNGATEFWDFNWNPGQNQNPPPFTSLDSSFCLIALFLFTPYNCRRHMMFF